jgi:hypothetical protein
MAKTEKKKSIWLKLLIAFVLLCSLASIAIGIAMIFVLNLSTRQYHDLQKAQEIGNQCNQSCMSVPESERASCTTSCYERNKLWDK